MRQGYKGCYCAPIECNINQMRGCNACFEMFASSTAAAAAAAAAAATKIFAAAGTGIHLKWKRMLLHFTITGDIWI